MLKPGGTGSSAFCSAETAAGSPSTFNPAICNCASGTLRNSKPRISLRGPVIVATGLLQNHLENTLSRRIFWEYGVVGGALLVAVVFVTFR